MFDVNDLDNYDHGPHDYDEAEVARLEAEDELPAWRDRPTMPGLWVCIGTGRLNGHDTVLKLTQAVLDTGAPFCTNRVFGPIPLDPKGT